MARRVIQWPASPGPRVRKELFMADQQKKAVFDGATLSPKLKGVGQGTGLPIGKPAGPDGDTVARRYKHAAGKSSTYTPEVVDMIYHMSREGTFADPVVGQFVAAKLAAERARPDPDPPVTWDQLVFLSANLTRLVIDPYREKCNAAVTIGTESAAPMRLASPIVYGGIPIDRLPAPCAGAVVEAARRGGVGLVTPVSWGTCDGVQILEWDGEDPVPPLEAVAAVQLTASRAGDLVGAEARRRLEAVRERNTRQVPIGVVCPAFNGAEVVDALIDHGIDFCVADGQWTEDTPPSSVLPEAAVAPSIGVLADVVERLRHHCREEQVQVIYRGGIRGGADAGKAIAIGARAVTLGFAALVSTGVKLGRIDDEAAIIEALASIAGDVEAAAESMHRFAQSVVVEVTMLARACGKRDVVNMEPEDLRSLSRGVSSATGVGIVGKETHFRHAPGADSAR